jgi:ligand-binding sensor domain-containing protein/serine phosphatase RsbU (regulator of sigma subunit)
VWICWLIFNQSAESTSYPYSIRNYNVYDGLSGNHVTVLFQDSRGFIWIGTDDGLNRFDGYSMVIFRHLPLDTISISGNVVRSLCEDASGNIWVGTQGDGLSLWNRRTNRFQNWKHQSHQELSLPDNDVFGIYCDSKAQVWVRTKNYLAVTDNAKGEFISYSLPAPVLKADKNNRFVLMPDKSGVLWVGTSMGLERFSMDDNHFTTSLPSGMGSVAVTSLLALKDKEYLVGTINGLYWFNSGNGSFKEVIQRNSKAGDERINALLRDSYGQIWVGTKRGLELFNDFDYSTTVFTQQGSKGDVVTDEVTSLIEDRSGILWIGTRHLGVIKFNQRPARFQAISSSNPGVFKLDSYHVTAVWADEQHIWLGTADKGLAVIDRQKSQTLLLGIDVQRNLLREDAVLSFCRDRNALMWVGTNNGLYWVDALKKTVREALLSGPSSNILRDSEIRSILEDKSGHMWMATNNGLFQYDGFTLVTHCVESTSGKMCSDDIRTIWMDEEGMIWIGSGEGVTAYKPLSGEFEPVTGLSDELVDLDVISISGDGKGSIWIATRNGLLKLDKSTAQIRRFSVKNGLTTDMMSAVVCDQYGRAWVSTNKGVSMIVPDGDLMNFGPEDGLAGNVFSASAVFKSYGGELFFGGLDGVSFWMPDSLNVNLMKPNVVISKVKAYRQGVLVDQWLGESDTIKLKYRHNHTLSIEFASLEFTNPEKNHYRTFLEGFDDEWHQANTRNSVTYSNLSPGSYQLMIMGSNNDLVWNNDFKIVHIIIQPPLWMSNYAYAFYLIALIFIVQSIINYRIRNYRKAYRLLHEKAVDKKRIEAQKETLTRINKSLTDSINYAKRIQEAMLLSEDAVKRFLPESFIYFRPKDIVSGDFYYILYKDKKLYVAAVDCTGHGVPGAFMSIIGYDLIRNIIEIQGVDCPAQILNQLNHQLNRTFRNNHIDKGLATTEVNDGMDLSMCVVDFAKHSIEFAGAYNSLYLVRDNEIVTYEGNRFSVGFQNAKELFTKQVIEIEKNDVIYLFSDGYVDQFGGPDGKKFKNRRFRHLLLNIHKLPFEDQKSILHQKMEEWMGTSYEQLDDMLLIGFKPLG